MKKYSRIALLAFIFCCTLSGCDKYVETTGTKTTETFSETEQTTEAIVDSVDHDSDFIDLTSLSSTFVYSEVFIMMQTPEKYLGKTIKMEGTYRTSYSEETEKNYHFIVIEDAEACCQQGLEFALADGATYPPDGTRVTVEGTFKSYEELGTTYYYVSAAD